MNVRNADNNRRDRTAGSADPPERLSFQDLLGELGEPPALTRGDAFPDEDFLGNQRGAASQDPDPDVVGVPGKGNEQAEWPGTVPGDAPAEPVRRKRDENPLNARVLTESGARKTPLWVKTLYMSLAAWLLLVPLWLGLLVTVWQPWYSYSVMALGGGAVFWAAYGMYHEETVGLRASCMGGLIIGAGAMVAAFLMRDTGVLL